MSLRAIIVTASLLAGSLAAMPANAFQFGVCTHLALNRGTPEDVLSLLASGGFDSLRDDVFWSAMESDPGVLRFPEKFAPLRKALGAAAARGASPILILAFGNRNYDDGGMVSSPSGIDAYARYAGFVAGELKGQVRQFEVWNEWNTGFGSKPRKNSGDAADYVRVLEKAAAAIHRANPKAEVIGGVTSGVDLKWFRALIAAGGLDHLDAVSVHSYTLFRQEKNPEGAIASLDQLRKLLREAAPQREIPVYVTEIGWPTNHGKHGVSQNEAAQYLARFTLLARTRPWIGGVWWYDLIDDGDAGESAEHRFGLVNRKLEPKAAFRAAQAIAPLLKSRAAPQSFRFADGAYLVTGTDVQGRWAVGWAMERSFLSWTAGSTEEPRVADEFTPLATQLPADGYPVLFRMVDGRWRADARWLDKAAA
jgi:hypothetical protein